MNCCEAHASELRCDDCPWCRIAQLEAENKRLRELLIERDGGVHDDDCKIHNPGVKRCNCGHDEVVTLQEQDNE